MRAAHLGKMLGAFGLVLLLSSPFTYLLTSGSLLAAGIKAGLGVALLAVYLATNGRDLGQFASRRSSFFVLSSALLTLAVLGALIALNVIVARRNRTWDFTTKKIFTLAPQTRSTLHALRAPVQVTGFLPVSHPAYASVDALFARYRAEAPDAFRYSFKDPRKHPDLAAKFEIREGQSPIVLEQGETHTTLNLISEEELTNALVKLTTVGTQKLYFLSGHGEWPLNAPTQGLGEFKKQLAQEGYTAEPFNLVGRSEVPRDAALVVIAGARTAVTLPELALLERYLDEGGRMLYLAEAKVQPQLDPLLAKYGVEVDEGVVADAQFNNGNPYVPISAFYGEHPIAALLKELELNIQLPTARGLTLLREGLANGVKAVPVVLTSPAAWIESTPDGTPRLDDGEKSGQLPLVTASTRPIVKTEARRFDEARLVVVGDSELVLDVNWGHEPNRNLVMNALGWATNQVNRITIRPPDRDLSTVELSPTVMSRVRFVATDLFPMSLMGVGIAIWLSRRNR